MNVWVRIPIRMASSVDLGSANFAPRSVQISEARSNAATTSTTKNLLPWETVVGIQVGMTLPGVDQLSAFNLPMMHSLIDGSYLELGLTALRNLSE